MSDINLSQTAPISALPRDYLSFLRRSDRKEEPVVFLRHGKPVGALMAKKVLDHLLAIVKKYEEEKALKTVSQGMREYRVGKVKKLKSVTELMD